MRRGGMKQAQLRVVSDLLLAAIAGGGRGREGSPSRDAAWPER